MNKKNKKKIKTSYLSISSLLIVVEIKKLANITPISISISISIARHKHN